MYLSLQGTRILVSFLRVSAVVRQKACMHAIGTMTSGQARGLHGDAGRSNAHGYRSGCALEQPAAWSWCLRVVLVARDAVWGFLEGARDFKARSAAKEHTNDVRSGGRDPGVSGPGTGLGQSPTHSKLIPCVFTCNFFLPGVRKQQRIRFAHFLRALLFVATNLQSAAPVSNLRLARTRKPLLRSSWADTFESIRVDKSR